MAELRVVVPVITALPATLSALLALVVFIPTGPAKYDLASELEYRAKLEVAPMLVDASIYNAYEVLTEPLLVQPNPGPPMEMPYASVIFPCALVFII